MAYSTTQNAFDTYVNSAYPTKNYSAASVLRVKSGSMFAYVSFGRPFQARSTVERLELVVRVMGDYPAVAGRTFTAKRQGNRKALYRDLNYANRPAAHSDGVTIAKAGALKAGDELVFPVAAHGQIWADGADFDGWEISTNSAAEVRLYSTDSTASWAQRLEPELRATVADPPAAPINLAPSGNRVVGVQKFVARWSQIDNNNGKAIVGARIQIDNVASFAAPDFDTGEQPAEDGSMDLANLVGVVFAGLPADGSPRYWRVSVIDSSGTESEFSDPVSVRYQPKGSLTITSPSASSGKVSDPTPNVSWALDGATQRAYRLELYRKHKTDNVWMEVWDSYKKTSADQLVTIPARQITYDDRDYKLRLAVWDTVPRQTTPGSTAAYIAERIFRFDDDAAVVPVRAISVSQEELWPRVDVRVVLDQVPDRLIISRDGKIIGDVEAADLVDLRQSDGSYVWADRAPIPGRLARYTARPLANGKMGWGNPSATITCDIKLRWLVTDDFEVLLGGTEQDLKLAERATVHETVGDAPPVRIVQGMPGYSGPISGRLVRTETGTSLDNVSSKTWRDRFMRIKHDQIPCTFIAGDLCIPVNLEDGTAQPSSLPRSSRGDLVYTFEATLTESERHDWEAYG